VNFAPGSDRLRRLRVPAGHLARVEVPVPPAELLGLEAPLPLEGGLHRDGLLADGEDGPGVAQVERVVLHLVTHLEPPHGDELVVTEVFHDHVGTGDEGDAVLAGTRDVLDDVHGSTLSLLGGTLHHVTELRKFAIRRTGRRRPTLPRSLLGRSSRVPQRPDRRRPVPTLLHDLDDMLSSRPRPSPEQSQSHVPRQSQVQGLRWTPRQEVHRSSQDQCNGS